MVQDEPAEELLDGGVLGVLLDEDGGGVVPPPASQAVAFSASCASVPLVWLLVVVLISP